MKKAFKSTVKKTRKKPTAKTTLEVMTPEMRELYTDFYTDKERLENEWKVCIYQYEKAKRLSLSKEATFDSRMMIRKIAGYWHDRKIALEKTLDIELLKKFQSNLEIS